MQYITPAGETGTKVGETPPEFNEQKYHLELPSEPGEAPRFEWFLVDELTQVDGTTGLPGPVPQEPVEEMDLQAQLQQENAEQALEIIELTQLHETNVKSIGNLARQLDTANKTIASLQSELEQTKAEFLDRSNKHIMQIAQLKHDLKAFTDVYGPKVPAVPTPSDNATNAG